MNIRPKCLRRSLILILFFLSYFKLTLAAGFNGAVYSGFLVFKKSSYVKLMYGKIQFYYFFEKKVNHMDVASNFAGSMMGITNCVAQVCGFVVPAVVGAIVTDEV